MKIIEKVHQKRVWQPRLGVKKLYYMLKNELPVGRDKFYDILRDAGLLVKRKRQYMKTTNSYHRFRTYKNQVQYAELTASNQAWAADITYLRTETGFVYLSLLTDLFSRKIVGWHVSNSLSIEGALKTCKQALRQCKKSEGLIHHSDRGIQYCSNAHIKLLKKNKITISMTEENHCYENATAERVNGILKDEFLLDATFKNIHQAQAATKQAIETYNNCRPHWSLGLKTPAQVHDAA